MAREGQHKDGMEGRHQFILLLRGRLHPEDSMGSGEIWKPCLDKVRWAPGCCVRDTEPGKVENAMLSKQRASSILMTKNIYSIILLSLKLFAIIVDYLPNTNHLLKLKEQLVVMLFCLL